MVRPEGNRVELGSESTGAAVILRSLSKQLFHLPIGLYLRWPLVYSDLRDSAA
jgi:hypothetical protein